MTLQDAKYMLRAIGMTITRKAGEYRVNYAGGKEATAAYDNDLDAAIWTGRAMYGERARRVEAEVRARMMERERKLSARGYFEVPQSEYRW